MTASLNTPNRDGNHINTYTTRKRRRKFPANRKRSIPSPIQGIQLVWVILAALPFATRATVSEREVLEDFYDFTKGDSWKAKDGWKTGSSVCDWHGIICDTQTQQVIRVDLNNNNLNGAVPGNFWKLTGLKEVSLRNNLLTSLSLDGMFTSNSEMDPRSPVEIITVSQNHLTSLDGIGYAHPTLRNLHVNKNQIDSTLPDDLFNCLQLETLYVAFNQIQGPIPTHMGRLTRLTELYAFDNRISGTIPTELGLLDQLQVLGLGNNLFTGNMPSEFEQMVNLRDIAIHNAVNADASNRSPGLTGPLPLFANMPYLSILFLDGNSFTGPIPSAFLRHNAQTDQPVSIGITNNLLTGTVPKSLERFEALSIDLVGNQITEIPEVLCEKGGWMGGLVEEFKCDAILCPLDTYNVLGRAFSTQNPCQLCADGSTYLGTTRCEERSAPLDPWKILGAFYLAMAGEKWTIRDGWEIFDNLVVGGTIDDLENLGINICDGWYGIVCDAGGGVTDVSLPSNELFGTVPDSIFTLPSLKVFDVSNNNVQMESFKGTVKADELTSLILSNVKVLSTSGIGNVTKLEHLFLDGLNIKGPLPDELFRLTNLKTLHLQHGDFEGTIPATIGQLAKLDKLNIYGNELVGTLPVELCSLTLLRALDLSENAFTGSIPTEISALSELEAFAIHQSNSEASLSGPLPPFDTFPELKELSLEANRLTGSIPANFLTRISDKASEITISLGFNEIEGPIPASLNAFEKLVLRLEGNQITSIPDILCFKDGWMQGEIGKLAEESKCNAILCPPRTWNDFGKQTDEGPCLPCDTTVSPFDEWGAWYGQIRCGELVASREKEILDKLFLETGGRYWKVPHDNWLKPGVPICQREGVFCADSNANEGVMELRMSRFGMRGTIPSEIWELSNARQLAFTKNEVDVSFDGIEQAQALVVLKLSNCHLRTLSGLGKASKKLRELHIAVNQFNGTIPEELFELDQVQLVYLNNNHFSGAIPTDLSRMTSLSRLEIFDNRLTGPLPSELGLLTDLTIIDMQQNELSGAIPTEIFSLQKLSKLVIAKQEGKKMEGQLPAFDRSPLLVELDASDNGFSGILPPTLLAQVNPDVDVIVNLSGNRFDGTIPSEWSRFESLNIDLSGNRLTGIPEGLCQMNGWNKGLVGLFSTCDAILCPPGSYAPTGRQSEATQACSPCDAGELSAPFYGTRECLDPKLVAERRILTDFYENAAGSNWLSQTNWLSYKSVCTWHGVSCNENKRVLELELANNLIASDPSVKSAVSEILTLEELMTLDLKGNQVELDFAKIPQTSKLEFIRLSGTGLRSLAGVSLASSLKALHVTKNEIRNIPEEVYAMANLESLFLSYNAITGTVSRRFGEMTSLQELYIFGNRLTGTIPTEFGMMVKLVELVLAKNYLSGTVPDEMSSLPILEQVSLFDQQGVELITGPVPSFSEAPRLWYFDASDNDLTGPLPDNFMINSAFKNETITIHLQNNDITGTIPFELSSFDYLDIDLAGNRIMEIPSELCALDGWMQGKAKAVDGCSAILCPVKTFNQFGHESAGNPCLPCVHLDDDIFLGHTHCENFTSERDTLNKIYEMTGGEFWSNSTNWRSEAPICSWEGVLCEDGDLQDAEGITALRLDKNGMTGTLPSEVWTLPALRYLSIKENPDLAITFDGLRNAANTLEVLYLTEIKMSSLKGVSDASRLRELHVTGNDIKGTFPEEVFALSNTLESLYLANNLFYGPLPKRLGQMTKLQVFYAFDNDFLSTIPSELGRLQDLKILVLAENLLFGQIPQELSEMPSLQVFAAFRREKSGPRLSGSLPSFSKLPQLTGLYLQGNEIQGPIPDEFVSASQSVQLIRLDSNMLTGVVPENLGQISDLSLELAGNLIEGFPPSFCEKNDWMEGAVNEFGCDGFLCRPGTASPLGRSQNATTACEECSDKDNFGRRYYGALSCKGPANQREILVNLYYALNGDAWHRKDFWGSTADVCDWYGIGCMGGQVVIVNLRGNNLRGLPGPDLFYLSELRTLWLYSNPLEFSFENIGSARKLQDLRLDSTMLHSLRGIGAATSLVSFDASFTALRGSFPADEIIRLTNLRNLKLNDNSITGTLPKSIGPLKYLVNLRLDSNRLTGNLPAFEDMHFLDYIDLSDNSLSGPISRKFFSLLDSGMEPTIRLVRNQLTGVVPQEFDRFKEMTIHLTDNEILGLPLVLCDNKKWNNGEVGRFGCDAILCRPGTSNIHGRWREGTKCYPCPGATYYGETVCPIGNSRARSHHQWTTAWVVSALVGWTLLK